MKKFLALLIVFLLLLPEIIVARDIQKGKGRIYGNRGTPNATSSDGGGGGTEPPGPTVPPCTHYAAPANATPPGLAGNPGTSTSPFRIQDFWSVSNLPGKVLCLKNGTYLGTAYMINPPSSVDGTSANPIWVRAENDGGVLLDRQFATGAFAPVNLSGNNWINISGINARNGERDVIRVGDQSNNIKVLRSIFWDTSIGGNTQICTVTSVNGPVLFEDVGCFGTGRKTIGPTQSVVGFTCRRCWSKFEGSLSNGPIGSSLVYNTTDSIYEGSIFMWDANQMPPKYEVQDGWLNGPVPQGIFCGTGGGATGCENLGETFGDDKGAAGAERMDSSPFQTNSFIYGSMALVLQNDKIWNNPAFHIGQNQGQGGFSNFTARHVFGFVHPSNSRFNNGDGKTKGHRFTNPFAGGVNLSAQFVTSVGGIEKGTQWTISNDFDYSTISAMNSGGSNPFTATNGAKICYNYINGIRQDGTGGTTRQGLFPWSMNQRIKDATLAAGAYSGPCTGCTNANGTTWTRVARPQVDVDAILTGLFGAYPAECQ